VTPASPTLPRCPPPRPSASGSSHPASRGSECHRQDRTDPRQKKISDQSSRAETNRSPNNATDGFSHARLFCVLRWHCLLDNRVRGVWCQNNYLVTFETCCLQIGS